ncbi:hypothetical protein [Halorussus litoreus]|uniref:hypothetical protein n=1 Tax=Halorussus litoreus TaxID=1710536 RepID=UPI000E21E223|nr:hypothetical protein [Halorussus litoreus]
MPDNRPESATNRVAIATLAGAAGIAGGLAWAVLPLLWFAADGGTSVLGYGVLDLLTLAAFPLALAGVAAYRARTADAWGRLATAGFALLAAGLTTGFSGSLAYVLAGLLAGWTLAVWGSLAALVGATVLGAGLLVDGVEPRVGAVLLTSTLPVGVPVSLALAVSGIVPTEAVVSVGPGLLFGGGVAALGVWVWREK